MSTSCQLVGWIYNLYGRSFIRECMLCSLLFLFLLQLIHLSMHLMFFLELLLQRMQLLLCSILYLRAITPSPHSPNLQSFFHHRWICLSLQLCSASVLPTTFFLHSLHLVYCRSWCCLLWCYCHHIFMYLSTNNLMSSWVGKLIDTWSNASPSVLWTMSSTFLSWKTLYLCCWEEDEHLWYLETWKHSWQAIFHSKTKMNLRANLQHTCVTNHEGHTISTRRSGDWLPRLRKA